MQTKKKTIDDIYLRMIDKQNVQESNDIPSCFRSGLYNVQQQVGFVSFHGNLEGSQQALLAEGTIWYGYVVVRDPVFTRRSALSNVFNIFNNNRLSWYIYIYI